MVTETWFKEVIEEEPDFFLLVGYRTIIICPCISLTKSFHRHMAIQKNKCEMNRFFVALMFSWFARATRIQRYPSCTPNYPHSHFRWAHAYPRLWSVFEWHPPEIAYSRHCSADRWTLDVPRERPLHGDCGVAKLVHVRFSLMCLTQRALQAWSLTKREALAISRSLGVIWTRIASHMKYVPPIGIFRPTY